MDPSTDADTAVVIAAGGSGRRFGGLKQFLPLAGRPMLEHSLEVFAPMEEVVGVVVVCPAEHRDAGLAIVDSWRGRARLGARTPWIEVVAGGVRRQDSVRAGLDAIGDRAALAIVHDAARPLVRGDDVRRLIVAIRARGAGVIGTPSFDSVKRVDAGEIVEEPDRNEIWLVQTPQGATLENLRAAYSRLAGETWTDESSMLRAAGFAPALVEGSRDNLKITSPGDERLAEALFRARAEDR